MTTIINRLTKQDLKRPKKRCLCDGQGLWLRSGPDDDGEVLVAQGFYYRYTSPLTGRKRPYWLGRMSLDAARGRRVELAQQIRAGRCPADEQRNAKRAKRARQALARSVSRRDSLSCRSAMPSASDTPAKVIGTQTTALAKAQVETFTSVAERYLALHGTAWEGENTLRAFKRDVLLVSVAIPKPPLQVTLQDVDDVVRPWWETKPKKAEHLLYVMEKVIGHARAEVGLDQAGNPAIWKGGSLKYRLGPKKKSTNHPAYPHEQAPALWQTLLQAVQPRRQSQLQGLDTAPVGVCVAAATNGRADIKPYLLAAVPALMFMLATGCRGAEVRRLRWGWIDFDQRVIKYPARVMKNRREHWQPISDAARHVLSLMGPPGPAGQHVFRPVSVTTAGPRQAKDSDLELDDSYLSKCLGQLTVEDAVAFSTAHGFRSTIKTWLSDHSELGCDRHLAESILSHATGSATEQAYQKSMLVSAKRKYLNLWASFLLGQHVEGMI